MLKKSKIFLGIAILCVLLISFLSTFFLQQKPEIISAKMEIKSEKLVDNYSTTTEKGVIKGSLYELDVLFNNNLNSEMIKEYVNNIDAPEGAISIKVKFYDNYSDSSEKNREFLKYEMYKIL